MGYEDRKDKIIEYLKSVKFATFKELSNILNVSEMTVRRDVKNLEDENLVNRKYKGIELNRGNNLTNTSILNTNVNIYHNYVNDVNYKIIEETTRKIISYRNIFLVSGNLNLELAKFIEVNYKKFKSIDFITSDIKIASILGNANLNVFIISGKVNKNNINIIEGISSQFLDNIIIDLLILEPEAIDKDFGISDNNIFNANNKKILIDRSKNILLLTQPNNFDKRALYKIIDLDNRFSCITAHDSTKTLFRYEDIISITYV
ncbi:MAG: DeoR/GlpR family DNA-binding transcription regulator [Deferribacterota bacterium]|nr:DeoR/GlpR family DNA-binding transcription regulator [Deferribacterota bacterium]